LHANPPESEDQDSMHADPFHIDLHYLHLRLLPIVGVGQDHKL